MEQEDLIRRINALLAKAEATEFEAEAGAYLAKAEDLMTKYDIEHTDLDTGKRKAGEEIVSVMIDMSPSNPDRVLWNGISVTRDVKMIRHGNSGNATLVGYPTDLTYVQALATSLMLQRERFLRGTTKPVYENGRTFNHSFRMGYANRIYNRLMDAKRAAQADAGTGTDLVFVGKERAVSQRYNAMFPNSRTSSTRVAINSRAGHQAGREAGGRASLNLGERNLGGSRRAVSSS